MNEKRYQELAETLKAVHQCGKDQKETAKELIEATDAADFPCADRKLASAEGRPEEMQHLCSQHLDMMGQEVENLKASLEPGHVIHTMICEHEMILGFLEDLNRVSQSLPALARFDAKRNEFEKLRSIASHLIGAEAHHKREEDVLFPEIEKRGLLGPPRVMRMEHDELRKRKKVIREMAYGVNEGNFDAFKKALPLEARGLVSMLREHIAKENNILYPMALQIIAGKEDWDRLKADCDKIGYCCFTPTKR